MIFGGTFDELKQFIADNNTICFDIETTGLNRRKDAIIGFGLSNGIRGFYVSLSTYDVRTNRLVQQASREEAVTILGWLRGKQLWTFNGAFDLAFTKNYFDINLIDSLHTDGLLLAHTCNENRFNYSLKGIAEEIFGPSVLSEQADMKASIKLNGGTKTEFYKADTALMAKYCIQDCLLTWRLIEYFQPILTAEDLWQFFYDDEVMPLYKHVTLPMEAHGIAMDVPLMQQALQEITADITAIEASIIAEIQPYLEPFLDWYLAKDYPPSRQGTMAQAICKYANLNLPRTPSGAYSITEKTIQTIGDRHWKGVLEKTEYMTPTELRAVQLQMLADDGITQPFNLSSGHHLKRLFFNTLNEQPLSRTPTGQPQADDDFLDSMASKYSWAEDLRTYRRLMKIKGTYIERFLEELEDGRFYPQYKQHGTVTGRYSGDFQQLPRPLEVGDAPSAVVRHTNAIRNFFIADHGTVFIDADYESLEPHVFAHISKDPAVIEIFNSGHDFYSTVAIKTEGLHDFSADKTAPNYLGKANKAKRQSAKAYALGIAYGEEDWKLHHELNITQDEAKKLVSGYWAGFPVLKQTSDAGKQQILQHGYICSETGRRRRLLEAKQIAEKHGHWILNSLELWKAYNDTPGTYDHMKVLRKRLKKSLNAAINFPTQSLSASIVNRAAIAINKAFKASNLNALVVGQVHDELLVSCSKDTADQAAQIMQQIMCTNYKLSVPLKAEPIIGLRYGEVK